MLGHLLGAIVLFSAAILLDKHVLNQISVFSFIFFINIFFTINFWIMGLFFRKKFLLSKKEYFHLSIIGLLIIGTQFAQYTAKSMGPIGIISPVLLLSSFITLA